MSEPMKNVLLQLTIEDTLSGIWPQTGADNVIIDSATGKTLATRLSEIVTELASVAEDKITASEVNAKISAEISKLINGAPETYDTFKEIADYISTHQSAADALTAAVGKKVDKVDGKGLSTNDFTNDLLKKLNAIAEGATKVTNSNTNGYINVNNTETPVYIHPTTAGNKHLPAGGTIGQVLRATGDGTGTWGENVRSGATTPKDLAPGELFIKLL